MKKSLILAGISVFLLSSTMSIAQAATTAPEKTVKAKKECPKDFKRPPHKGPNLDQELNLTEAQKAQAKELRMKGHEKIKPIFDEMKAKKVELSALKANPEANKEKIDVLHDEIKALKIEARKIRQENMKEFEAILTPEQKAKFDKIKQEGREKFKKEHRGGHPQGKPGHMPPPHMN